MGPLSALSQRERWESLPALMGHGRLPAAKNAQKNRRAVSGETNGSFSGRAPGFLLLRSRPDPMAEWD